MEKAQASLEYLVITAFVLLVVGILAFFALINYDQTISQSKINQAVSILGNAANQVYAAGPGNTVFVEIDLPNNIESGYAGWHSINYVIGTIESGDVFVITNGDISYGLLPITEGRHYFKVSMEDENVSIVETGATALNQAELFSFDWSTASFTGGSKQRLDNWTIENNGGFNLTVKRMKVDWINDTAGGLLRIIKLKDDVEVYGPGPNIESGTWVDVNGSDGVIIESGQSYSTNNRVQWNGETMNDEGEQFTLTFEFSDGSQFVTQTCTAVGDSCD